MESMEFRASLTSRDADVTRPNEVAGDLFMYAALAPGRRDSWLFRFRGVGRVPEPLSGAFCPES